MSTSRVKTDFETFPTSKYGTHRSDAPQRIAAVSVIEVDGELAICTGGAGPLGHPTEFMTLTKAKE
ncbi:hypothetical protein JKP88DRAFT_349000, partial [Tribonema minus]